MSNLIFAARHFCQYVTPRPDEQRQQQRLRQRQLKRENNAELKGKCENRVLNVSMSEAEPIQAQDRHKQV